MNFQKLKIGPWVGLWGTQHCTNLWDDSWHQGASHEQLFVSHMLQTKNQLTQKVTSRLSKNAGDAANRPTKYSDREKNILKNIFLKKWIPKNWKLARGWGCGAHNIAQICGMIPDTRGHPTSICLFPTCRQQKISWPQKGLPSRLKMRETWQIDQTNIQIEKKIFWKIFFSKNEFLKFKIGLFGGLWGTEHYTNLWDDTWHQGASHKQLFASHMLQTKYQLTPKVTSRLSKNAGDAVNQPTKYSD